MTTTDFIIELFCRVDLKGTTSRHFYRWIKRDYLPLFPNLPERTRLARLFKTHQHWAALFLAEPTILGVTDSFGIEFCHPVREMRFPNRQRIGKSGTWNVRMMVESVFSLLTRVCHSKQMRHRVWGISR